MVKILFLIPYPLDEAPSQRFRFELFFPSLKSNGCDFTVQSFFDSYTWRKFSKPGDERSKILALLKGFTKRLAILFSVRKYDFVFIHREATPIGPPIIEWIISKVLFKKIIYDFDDAIWLTDRQSESFLLKAVKWRTKVKNICLWAYKVSCGNQYLCEFALLVNSSVCLIPSVVDTEGRHNPDLFRTQKQQGSITIGWTGSYSTLKYLEEIEDILIEIERDYPGVRFRIIADKKPSLNLHNVDFIAWNSSTEIEDLMHFDIGLMPLPDDNWVKGKCGFKIIQYLALGIPAVASAVGVNPEIISQGKTGFLCHTKSQWYKALKLLIENEGLRNSFGASGREFIKSNYSASSNVATFLKLFE